MCKSVQYFVENLLQWVFCHYLAECQRVRTNFEPKLERQLQQKNNANNENINTFSYLCNRKQTNGVMTANYNHLF